MTSLPALSVTPGDENVTIVGTGLPVMSLDVDSWEGGIVSGEVSDSVVDIDVVDDIVVGVWELDISVDVDNANDDSDDEDVVGNAVVRVVV